MKIVSITDIHGQIAGLDEISHDLRNADLVLLTGDITHFGHENDALVILDYLLQYNTQLYAVAGNCDFSDVSDLLLRKNMSLHGRCIQMKNFNIIGLEGSLPCPGHTPNEYSERELAAFLTAAKKGNDDDKPLVLVSHQPPYNTLNDMILNGVHVGSKAVRVFIEEEQPLICFTGHIHEGFGIDSIGRTKIVNPGPFRHGGYAWSTIKGETLSVEIKKWRK
jgi:Icc-related predicted phosphoesterase